MKSAIGIRWVLMTPWVRLDSHSVMVSLAIATTSSAAITRSAVPVTMRDDVTSAGFCDRRTWLSTAPPFCASPDMSRIMLALPSICAAMPSSAPMVRTAAQLAAIDGDEGRAETLEAGIILVAARLVDGALAPHLGLQRLHRNAVRLHRAVAAAFAHRRIDQHPPRRILQRAALAA